MVLSLQSERRGRAPGPSARAGHPGRATSTPGASTSPSPTCSRPASTCGWGSGRCASAAASCPATDTVERKLKDYILDEIDLRGDGAMLEARCPYLIELKERLDLPAGLRGKANPKSSTGRIDVFTRVITDHSDRFDEMAPATSGPLYLEVVPLSFAVRVREDLTLNQLRLVRRPPLAERRRGARRPRGGADPVPGRGAGADRATWCWPTASSSASTCTVTRRAGSATAPGTARRCSTSPRALEVDPAPVLGPGLPGGGRPPGAVAQALLPADVQRGGQHPAVPGGRDDGLRPDQRRAAHALRRLLRPGLRLRPQPDASGARGPPSRCGRTTCRSWSRTGKRCASSPSSGCWRSRSRSTAPTSGPPISNRKRP